MRRRPAVTVAALAAALAGLVAGLPASGARGQPAIEISAVDEGRLLPVPDRPVFFLALGLDGGRAGLLGDRADAIHLIGVNAAAGRATMLNIPRDTYVDIPGYGRAKINEAYFHGGAGLMADTVERFVGADVAFVLALRFDPFQKMVDDMGGLLVDVPFAMNDKNSGARFAQGPVHMTGGQVLAFARNRYIPGGDIGRSENQGRLILAALAALRAQTPGVTDTARYLAVLGRHVSVTGIGYLELYRLGRLGVSISPGDLRSVTMPSRIGAAGAASVVFPGPAAGALFADLRDDAVLQSH